LGYTTVERARVATILGDIPGLGSLTFKTKRKILFSLDIEYPFWLFRKDLLTRVHPGTNFSRFRKKEKDKANLG